MIIPAWLKNTSYVIAGILGITVDMVSAFGMLLVIDFITGTTASAFARGFDSLKSRTAWRGVFAKVMLVFALCSISYMATVLEEDFKVMIKSCLAVLAVAEVYSIWANVYMINTGKVIEEIDAFTPILGKFKRLFDVVIGEK